VKLVPKLTLALLAGVLVVVAGYTAWRVKGDIELFDQDARRDQRVVGITAGAALAKSRTRDDAIRVANRVDQSRERMRVRYVSITAAAPEQLRPLLLVAQSALPRPGSWTQVVKPAEPGSEEPDLLLTYVASPVADDPHGAMELSQPLASRADYAWRGVWSAVASGLAMLLVGGVTMAFIGARVVGRPIAELISAARRIGEGDFEVLAASKRSDELGELFRAMRAMSLELAAERGRASAEAEARIKALEQLRHAERLSTLGQMASVLAHEIGTPLNVIAGHGKLIASGRLGPSEVHESAAAIGVQSDRITSIVRRVLDYARRTPPKRTRVDLASTARQTRAMLRSLADHKEVEIELSEMGEPSDVFADPGQLQQALTNVVINAIHASPARARVLTAVRSEARSIEGQTKGFVVFTVRDFGPGIEADVQDRIFDPFFTTKPPGEGTGLGLSVARDIVTEHGGFIELSRAAGGGSSFAIYLPRSVET
jgi:two-component system, NtrC family, sensor kinase